MNGLAALLAFGFLGSSWALYPFSYNRPPYLGAKLFFQSHAEFKDDPEFAGLLKCADDNDDAGMRTYCQQRLRYDAYALGLALGEINSGGAAPEFFKVELDQSPIAYKQIIARFGLYQLTHGSDGLGPWRPARSRLDLPDLRAVILKHAQRLGWAFPEDDVFKTPPIPAPPKIGPDGLDWELKNAVNYRQNSYKPQDLQGDVYLALVAHAIPKAIVSSVLSHDSMPWDHTQHPFDKINPILPDERLPDEKEIMALKISPEEKEKRLVELRNRKLVIEGRNNPIRAEAMEKMFTQIFSEEAKAGLPPKFGSPHMWSAEFQAKYRHDERFVPYTIATKLLMSLSVGITSKFMATGEELALLSYALSRPDGSVTVHELFRESYELNKGDVYLALLTCENILSEFWRTENRENRALTRKLSPIASMYQGRGDKFGSWYHFFGIMLYAYVTNEELGRSAAKVENMGSVVLSDHDKVQKAWLGSQGAVMGAGIKRILMHQEWVNFQRGGTDYLDPKAYLDHGEDFRDRAGIAESRDVSAVLVDRSLYITPVQRNYDHCKLEIIPDYGEGFDAREIVVEEGESFQKGVTEGMRRLPRKPKKARVFLSGCDGGAAAARTAEPW